MAGFTSLLLIDDDSTTRELLQLLLGAEGWQVSTAEDGEAALGQLRAVEEVPDAILCDLQMPGLSGSALASALTKSAGERGGSPVLLAMTATAGAAVPAGFDALLVKPFEPGAVRARCEALRVMDTVTPSVSSFETDEPVLLPATLDRMRASMSAAQFTSLYSFALDDAEERVRRMSAAVAAGDDTALRKEAHALKGSCGMIGALRLGSLAARVEEGGIDLAKRESSSAQWNGPAQFLAAIATIRLMLEAIVPGGTD